MKRFVLMSLLLMSTVGMLFAQAPGSSTLAGPNSGSTVMVNTTKGLFALRAGVLAKYSFATLQQVKELQLFGPMPAAPTDNTDRTAMQQYMTEVQRRMASAIMIAKDDTLLIVVGDGFARINQDTLKVEVTGDLSPAVKTAETDTGRGGMRMMDATPGYLLVGNTLCLMRSKEMLSVSITTGKVLARSALPKELQPLQFNFPGGGRNFRNGGSGGGGTRGNNAPGAPTQDNPPAQ